MFCALLLASSAFNGPAVSRVARSQSAVAMKEPGAIVVKNSWVKVCDASSLKPNTLNPTFAAGQDILIAVEKSGTVYATANVCPHIGTPLDQGKIKDGCVVCPLHGTAFDLGTGKLTGAWCPSPPIIGPLTGALKAPRDLPVFPVRQRGGSIEVFVDLNARARFDSGFWKGILDAQGKADGGYY
ncbi:hypothetical protein KFE25_009907 [Diacronema lutheri]|uniref:Rieske domain-containing protein n=2 Tax=Diacronema lutheri TaxID=2081491 RepID=A0A8J5XPW1_DIALT|nr:hypothetical protein KFE25_009907 [Diacronema lutheri]